MKSSLFGILAIIYMVNGCLRVNEYGECGCASSFGYIDKETVALYDSEFYAILENSTTYPVTFHFTDCKEVRISCSDSNDQFLVYYTNWGELASFDKSQSIPILSQCNKTTRSWDEEIEGMFFGCIDNYTGPKGYSYVRYPPFQ